MRSLNKIDDNTDDSTYGVCYGFIRKLTGWFTVQVMNYPHQCTMLKIILHKDKKSTRMCGPIYMDLDDYKPYNDAMSYIFEE